MKISQIRNKTVFDRSFKATSPKHAKRKKKENKLKKLETNTNHIENSEYIDHRNKLDKIY